MKRTLIKETKQYRKERIANSHPQRPKQFGKIDRSPAAERRRMKKSLRNTHED